MNPREFCREKGYPTAILLTYNFDPNFFEQVVLRDLEVGETEDILVIADPKEIASSVVRWKDQAAQLGRKYQLVPAMGAKLFHPKMIIRVGSDSNAVWLGSGNLTFGGWGGNQELATSWSSAKHPENSALLLQLLKNLGELVPGSPQVDVISRALSYLKVVSDAEQTSLENASILMSYGEDSLAKMLSKRWSGRRFRKVSVFTGSTDEKGAMIRWLHAEFGIEEAVVVVDQAHTQFSSKKLEGLPCKASIRSFKDSKRPLHAKFFWFEGDDGCAAVVGSANCSAAAWLVTPQDGGNIEAVTVYDAANTDDFLEILDRFKEVGLSDTVLKEKSDLEAAVSYESLVGTPDLSFDSSTGILSVTFPWAKSKIKKVSAECDGYQLGFDGTELYWKTEQFAMLPDSRTKFLEITLSFESGETTNVVGWVNDLSTLRHTSKVRKITDTLAGLYGPKPLSEHRKMLAELEKISRVLLEGSDYFSDSNRAEVISKESSAAPEKTEPINPDDFVKSIEEINKMRDVGNSIQDFHESIGIEAVLRAFFGRHTTDAEFVDDDELFDENSATSIEKKIAKRDQKEKTPDAEPPDERNRGKFKEIIIKFLKRLTEDQFVENCTVRQFQNAVALPFVMCDNGLAQAWINQSDASGLFRQAFDILFLLKQPGRDEIGLFARLESRHAQLNALDTWKKSIGDGTLWVLFLTTIGKTDWQGKNGAFQRKLAMRHIYQARELIETVNTGRIGQLIKGLDDNQKFTLTQASRMAKSEIDQLESQLASRSEELMTKQRLHRIPSSEGDLLWMKGGWAEVVEGADFGVSTNAYMHAKAEVRLVATKLFLNVTELSKIDEDVGRLLAEISKSDDIPEVGET